MKTLLVDCDPQANASSGLGLRRDPHRRSLYHAFSEQSPLAELIQSTELPGFEVLPSDRNLVGAAFELLANDRREFYLKEGLQPLRDRYDFILEIEGILLTMFDDRTNLTHQVAQDLRDYFGDQVFKTVIPRNIRLAEAPSHGKPIIIYDIKSRGAESYLRLAKEVLKK